MNIKSKKPVVKKGQVWEEKKPSVEPGRDGKVVSLRRVLVQKVSDESWPRRLGGGVVYSEVVLPCVVEHPWRGRLVGRKPGFKVYLRLADFTRRFRLVP